MVMGHVQGLKVRVLASQSWDGRGLKKQRRERGESNRAGGKTQKRGV